MNKYVHAVGLCVGLTAVIVLSGVNAAFLAQSGGEADFLPIKGAAYSICWFVSYLLTAVEIGEFAINERLRKLIFLPIIFIVTTALAFMATYKLDCLPLAASMFGLSLAAQGIILFVTIERTRLVWAGALANLIWYCLITGFVLIETICR